MPLGTEYKSRQCERFAVPGAVLHYRRESFWRWNVFYSNEYYPVLNISRGGLKFLSNTKIRAGTRITVKLILPDSSTQPELKAVVCWISLNPESSYRYQHGIAFNPYGQGRKYNESSLLTFFKEMESRHLQRPADVAQEKTGA
jgi:hypothetical protein